MVPVVVTLAASPLHPSIEEYCVQVSEAKPGTVVIRSLSMLCTGWFCSSGLFSWQKEQLDLGPFFTNNLHYDLITYLTSWYVYPSAMDIQSNHFFFNKAPKYQLFKEYFSDLQLSLSNIYQTYLLFVPRSTVLGSRNIKYINTWLLLLTVYI